MQVRQIPMAQLRELLDEQLAHGEALLPVTGNSMWPLLAGGRDMVRLARLDRSVQPGDIILYQRTDGSYILHRVIRLCAPDGCVCCGDAQWEGEQVCEVKILACVTAFRRKGRWQETARSRPYQFYKRFWVNTFPARRPLLKLLCLLQRTRRGLKRGRT